MSTNDQTFGTIENTQQFLSLLSHKIDEVLNEARQELSACKFDRHRQRVQAWQQVLYTTTKLSLHIANSRKLMTDLDTVRKVLDGSPRVAHLEA